MLQNILQKLYIIESIPSYPTMKDKLQMISQDIDFRSDNNLDKFCNFLLYDPSMTIKFLKIANADSFGFQNKISSLHNALLLLDDDLVKLIISQHPVMSNLKIYHEGMENEFLKLLKHSIEVQVIVQNILNVIYKEEDAENIKKEIHAAASLHDIGLIFLLIYFPDYYIKLINKIRESETAQQEQEYVPIPSHSFLGSLLCKFWNLPAFIRTSISFHHFPWASDKDSAYGSEILYLADSISTSFYDLFHLDDIYTVDEHIIMRRNVLEIIEKLEIDISIIAEIRIRSQNQLQDLYLDFGI